MLVTRKSTAPVISDTTDLSPRTPLFAGYASNEIESSAETLEEANGTITICTGLTANSTLMVCPAPV